MSQRWLIAALVIIAVVQVAVPVTMIVQREAIVQTGRPYKFRTRPVDPADAFRGRYVGLAFEQDHAPYGSRDELQPDMELFGRVEEAADGFAVVREVTAAPPDHGDYLKVQTHGWYKEHGGVVHFTLPFDRYYLEETQAPQAEQAYLEKNRRNSTNSDTYAVVRIKDGDAALVDLSVGGKPIQDYFPSRKP